MAAERGSSTTPHIAEGFLSLMTQPFATGTILTLDGGTLVG